MRHLLALLGLVLCLTGPVAAQPSAGGSGLRYQMVRHAGTGVRLPRITRLADAGVRDEVNARLVSALAVFSCGDPAEDGPATDSLYRAEGWSVDATTQVTLHSAHALSLTVDYLAFCGGAHPFGEVRGLTYDLRTGDEVALGSLFTDFERDSTAIMHVLYGRVLDRASRRAASLGASQRAEDCSEVITSTYADPAYGSPFLFALTPRGIRVWPDFVHAVQACAEANEVPYASVLRFTSPGSLLRRVAGRP